MNRAQAPGQESRGFRVPICYRVRVSPDLDNTGPSRLADLLPGFFLEISRSLQAQRFQEVHEQLPDLTIERWTWDPSCDAMYVYVGGVRQFDAVEENVIGVRYGESIPLDHCDGMVVIDVDNLGCVMGIEVIGRPDVYEILSKSASPMERLR